MCYPLQGWLDLSHSTDRIYSMLTHNAHSRTAQDCIYIFAVVFFSCPFERLDWLTDSLTGIELRVCILQLSLLACLLALDEEASGSSLLSKLQCCTVHLILCRDTIENFDKLQCLLFDMAHTSDSYVVLVFATILQSIFFYTSLTMGLGLNFILSR